MPAAASSTNHIINYLYYSSTVELRTALQGPTMGSRLSAIDRRQSLVAGTVFSGGCFFFVVKSTQTLLGISPPTEIATGFHI